MASYKPLIVCFAGLLLTGTGFAQQQSSPAVSVRIDAAQTTVAIAEPSDLRAVLDEFCKQTKAVCEGTQQLAESKVAPLTVQGPWNSVVDQLLEGSGVNYVATPPTAAAGGRLIIQDNATILDNRPVALTPQPADSGISKKGPVSSDGSARRGVASSSEKNNNAAARNAQSMAISDPQPASTATYTPSPTSLAGSPLTSDMSAGSVSAYEGPAYMPFPDSHGNPIPVVNTPTLYLPFPDSHGNPIPVDPNAPTGSPFPVEAIRQAQAH